MHVIADALTSVLAIAALTFGSLYGWLWLDPLVSLLIVVVIVANSWGLLRDSTSLALHAVPLHIDSKQVKSFLMQQPGVKDVHDLHIWGMSTTGIALSAHLLMPEGHPGDRFIDQLGHALDHEFHINHTTLQIEIGDAGTHCIQGVILWPSPLELAALPMRGRICSGVASSVVPESVIGSPFQARCSRGLTR